MLKIGWEHFAHDADMGVRGFGETINEAFEQTALAMTAVIANLDAISEIEKIEIACEAPDKELLLVDWLNEIIYEMASRNMLFGKFQVNIQNGYLLAQAWGEEIDILKHQPVVEVKGATYTSLSVTRDSNGIWIAQCVIDV